MPAECFVVYNSVDFVRENLASGGIFAVIAKMVIEIGGFVRGCIFDEAIRPIHIVSNEYKDIMLMQGSEYVQSD